MKFEFQLRDASPLIAGEGTVVWTRENDPSRPAIAPGMGVRFDRLAEGSQSVLEKILAEKAKQAPQRAPDRADQAADVHRHADARRAGAGPGRAARPTSPAARAPTREQTPLPKPMPFHSDADEFGAEAFEEATKVRALDELVAQTAAAEGAVPAAGTPAAATAASDELAARRTRDSGPPKNPPSSSATPRPACRARPSPATPAAPASCSIRRPRRAASKRPGATRRRACSRRSTARRPASASSRRRRRPVGRYEPTDRLPSQRMGVAAEPTEPAPRRPSSAPIVIGIVFTVAVARGRVLVLRAARPRRRRGREATNPGSGSALATQPAAAARRPTIGSAGSGSAVAMNGSQRQRDRGSRRPRRSTPRSPRTSRRRPSRSSTAIRTVPRRSRPSSRRTRPTRSRSRLPATSRPSSTSRAARTRSPRSSSRSRASCRSRASRRGGMIYVDGVATGKRTPADVELSTAQGARKQVHIQVRLAGYRMAGSGDRPGHDAGLRRQDDDVGRDEDRGRAGRREQQQQRRQHDPQRRQRSGAGSATRSTPESGSGAGSATPTAVDERHERHGHWLCDDDTVLRRSPPAVERRARARLVEEAEPRCGAVNRAKGRRHRSIAERETWPYAKRVARNIDVARNRTRISRRRGKEANGRRRPVVSPSERREPFAVRGPSRTTDVCYRHARPRSEAERLASWATASPSSWREKPAP